MKKESANKRLIESLFSQLESEYGYIISNKEYSDTYFVISDEADSICEFEIKQIPGFLFGLWNTCRFDTIEKLVKENKILWSDSMEIDSKSELVFFTNYKRDIDKFKPSRGGFVIGLRRTECDTDNNHINEWELGDLITILDYMRKHPIKSAEYTGGQTRYIWEEESGIRLFIDFIKEWYYEYKYRFKRNNETRKAIKIAKQLTSKLKTYNYYILDNGNNWSPRVDIRLRRMDNYDIELYQKDKKILDKYYDKYWHIITFNFSEIDESLLDDAEAIKEDKKLKRNFEKAMKDIINDKKKGIIKFSWKY